MLERFPIWFASVSCLCLLLLPAFVVVDVLTRAITGSPIAGVFEFSRLLLLTATCLAWPAVEYYGKHLRVDILLTNMSEARQAACRLAERVLTFVAFAIITGMAGHEWIKAYVGGFRQPGTFQIPTVVPLAIVVLGCMGVCLTIVLAIVLRRPPERPSET